MPPKTTNTRTPKLNLRILIVFLSILSVLIVATNMLVASFKTQRDILISGSLNYNYAYATKLASSVDHFLHSAQQQLHFSAQNLKAGLNTPAVLKHETQRLKQQTNSFNSVLIVDKNGVVLATDPNLGITGQTLSSASNQLALEKRRPMISPPFRGQTGRLLINISVPIFDSDNAYAGYISGTIYLNQPNILNQLLAEHFYRDDSYVYVVDNERRLLYHPESKRVGEVVQHNTAIERLVNGEDGSLRLINSKGIDMLAGFAVIPSVGWGVVAQRATDVALKPLDDLLTDMILFSLPLTLIIGLLIWWFSRVIASPLRRLAFSAMSMDQPNSIENIKTTPSWYFESASLKKGMLVGTGLLHERIGRLNRDATTDPLTGLLNRRAFNQDLANWQYVKSTAALICVDIDHFKTINDTYGHDEGDIVLQQLAKIMRTLSRKEDQVCRLGGEEFAVLMPDLTPDMAFQMAERLRDGVEKAIFNTVDHITISVGVAHWPAHVEHIDDLPKTADSMLYRAKNNGRNTVEMAPPLADAQSH
ncbi:MAG TPA: diguanylate cyclase [Pusillimonas sp.]|nr:diguanylate cyclase [Pusillimonas sp.]|tara:strand:- start:6088 stop:7686 length:1599 start_codon:yes stop_codon:yes gene_type:complete